MNRVLCSTGAVVTRKNGLNYGLLPEFAEKLCCDGFELMMSRSWYENFEKAFGGETNNLVKPEQTAGNLLNLAL